MGIRSYVHSKKVIPELSQEPFDFRIDTLQPVKWKPIGLILNKIPGCRTIMLPHSAMKGYIYILHWSEHIYCSWGRFSINPCRNDIITIYYRMRRSTLYKSYLIYIMSNRSFVTYFMWLKWHILLNTRSTIRQILIEIKI